MSGGVWSGRKVGVCREYGRKMSCDMEVSGRNGKKRKSGVEEVLRGQIVVSYVWKMAIDGD